MPAALAALTTVVPFNDRAAVEAVFAAQGDQIAALILEPVPANAGLYLAEPGFLDFLREITARHGALLIFDEVMTGFRVARGGYQELCGIRPDLSCFGKVIGGGLPVGAFGGRAEVMDMLAPDGPVYQAGTLSGNPLAMVAGLAQLRELERVRGWERLEECGALFEKYVRQALATAGKNYTFHRQGSMFCLFFAEHPVRNVAEAMDQDKAAFRRFFHSCLEGGVYVAPSPFEAGFLSLAHTESDIEETATVMARALVA